jgi:hypothetical protein
MGTESVLTLAITDLLRGREHPAREPGLFFTGESPNHRTMAAAAAYGWTMRHGTWGQKDQALSQVGEMFAQEARGHCAWGKVDECLSPSHFNFWALSYGGLRAFGLEQRDAEVTEATARWWRGEFALLALMSVPYGPLAGRIVGPGHRTFYKPSIPASGGNVTRDVVFSLVLGLRANRKKESWFQSAVDPSQPALDRVAAWIALELLRSRGDDLGGARAAALRALKLDLSDLPVLRDTLQIVRTPKGHVAWFERMTGLGGQPPQYWGWCDYESGRQEYGLQPTSEPPAPPGGWGAGPKIVIPGIG